MGKKIVYHGTWSDRPPHEVDQPAFHAGSKQSAHDRLFSGEGIPEGMGDTQTIHAYEIDESDVSRKLYSDPHFGETYGKVWPLKSSPYGRRVPENPSRILKYVNDHEDRGSLSYVIPVQAVREGRVRHLGVQFKDIAKD